MKNGIKAILKKVIPKKIWNMLILRDIGVHKVFRLLNKEQKKNYRRLIKSGDFWKQKQLSGGVEHPEITFYIIRRDCRYVGLFSIFLINIGHIRYAIEHGYVPVIDMKNYRNNYHEKSQVGLINTWEYYFEQPTHYTLEEAYRGKNIILCGAEVDKVNYPTENMSLFNNENLILDEWKRYAESYMKIKRDLMDEVMTEWKALIGDNKVLGVFLRGTDYIKLKPWNHPIQPDIEVVIKDIKEVLDDYGKLFIATEDISILERMKEEFGDKCVTNKREYVKYTQGNTPTMRIKRENDSYLQGKEYLTNVIMFSMCDGVIASRAGGSVGAAILSKNWSYAKIYDLGRYPLPEK